MQPLNPKKPLWEQVLKYGTIAACVFTAIYVTYRCYSYFASDDELQLQPTPTVLEEIKPIGELYALTAITEDFEIDVMEDVGFFITTYPKCIQTLRKQVSFVMDLDSVSYQPVEGTDTVVVRLPQMRFIQSGKGGTFLCESERGNYDATRLIGMVEHKIKMKYATANNYRRAQQNARQVIEAFVRQAGKVPQFEEFQ